MTAIKLEKVRDKYYIDLQQLQILGFDLPIQGTDIIIRQGIFSDWEFNFKLHSKKEGWDGLFVSPYVSEIGKRNLSDSEIYIEFSPRMFNYASLKVKEAKEEGYSEGEVEDAMKFMANHFAGKEFMGKINTIVKKWLANYKNNKK